MFRKDYVSLFTGLSVVLFIILSQTILFAQSDSTSSPLDTIVVTSSRVEEKLREVTNNMSVIDNQKIENSSANNLSDLLRQEGFQVRDYGGGTLAVVGIRGFRSDSHGNDLNSRVLILVNGRRNANGNVAKIPLVNVDHIEIIRGPASVQFGSAAMGGVVNIITKRGTGPLGGTLETGVGSNDFFKTEASLNGEYKALDFSGSYSFWKNGNYEDGRGTTYSHNKAGKNHSVNLDLGYNFLENHRIGLNVGLFATIDGEEPSGGVAAFPFGSFPYYNRFEKSNQFTDLTYEGSTSDNKLSWKSRFAFGTDKNDAYAYGSNWSLINPTDRPNDEYLDTLDSKLAQLQLSYDYGLFQLTGGFDYLDYDLKNQTNHPLPYLPSTTDNSSFENMAGFLIGKVRVLDERLIFTAGGRYDHFKTTVKNVNGKSVSEKHFSPSVGVAYSPVEWLKVRTNYSEGFKMPEPIQLTRDVWSNGVHIVGNPNLEPETSKTWEIGVDFSKYFVDAGLTYFYSEASNFIGLGAANNQNQTYQNFGKAVRSGLELELSANLGSIFDQDFDLRPYANVNWMTTYKAKGSKTQGVSGVIPTSSPDPDVYRKLLYIPALTLSYGITFENSERDLYMGINATYYGGAWEEDWDGNPKYANNVPAGIVKTDPYTIVDFSVKKKLMDYGDKGKLSLKVDANNIFDEYYEQMINYPGYGRNFYAGLLYEF